MRLLARSLTMLVMASTLLLGSACARKTDEAPPVATPRVTVGHAAIAVGSPMEMRYAFSVARTAPTFREDYWVFVHFLDKDGELLWTDDHEPATPTSQWKPGATIEYARTMFVPKFPYVGTVTVELGLFSRKSSDRLPLAGDNAGMRSYRVAHFEMQAQTENLFVIFRDGWHDTETSEEAGVEWQWSTQKGLLSFRNPKRDVVFLLQLDQPVSALGAPQQVDVQVGGATVDHFAVPVGKRLLRTIPLSAAQLGSEDTVAVAVAVDQTFTPVAIPQLRSSDARELGVRVFRAYVQPKVP